MVKNTILSWSRIIRILVYNLLFISILYLAYRSLDWQNFDASLITFDFPYLFLAIGSFSLFYLSFGFGWQQILRGYFGKEDKPLFLSYLAAQLFKYLPTSIFVFSSQAYFSKKMGIDLKKGAFAILVQYFFVLSTAVIVFLFFAKYFEHLLLFLLLFAAGFFVVHKWGSYFRFLPVVGKLIELQKISIKDTIIILAFHLSAWIFGGLSLYLFSFAIGAGADLGNTLAYQTLSTFAGILAVFAPGGIGVREYVLSFSELSLNAIVTWRVFTTIFDIVMSSVSIYILNRQSR